MTVLIRGIVQFLGNSVVTNTAMVTQDGQQKTSSVSVTLNNNIGNLQVTKTASADPVAVGQELTYQITVTNISEMVNTAVATIDGQQVSRSVTVAICTTTPCCTCCCGSEILLPESCSVGY